MVKVNKEVTFSPYKTEDYLPEFQTADMVKEFLLGYCEEIESDPKNALFYMTKAMLYVIDQGAEGPFLREALQSLVHDLEPKV